MRSLRLDKELDDRIRAAAAVKGASVSEFLRRAAAERAEVTLAAGAGEALKDVIGSIHGGGDRARRSGAALAELMANRASRR